jgi:hypothetical protein
MSTRQPSVTVKIIGTPQSRERQANPALLGVLEVAFTREATAERIASSRGRGTHHDITDEQLALAVSTDLLAALEIVISGEEDLEIVRRWEPGEEEDDDRSTD